MANKNIFDLPASGALVSTDNLEKQVTANGQNQKLTLAQMLTFIENNATAFAQAVNFVSGLTVATNKFQVAANGNIFISNTSEIHADGSAGFGSTGSEFIIATDGAISLGGGNFVVLANGVMSVVTSITAANDIEITNSANGLILKSANGTRYRLKVDNAGNLGTEPA
jgi:hypothetical protein